MQSIPYMIFRGGTSKGPFFFKKDLPEDEKERNEVICKIMGSPHPYQVDGIGGGVPNASKIGVISKSNKSGVDIEYAMGQVDILTCSVDMSGDCGNMLSAVGYLAIEANLVEASNAEFQTIRIYSPNTNSIKEVTIPIKHKLPVYKGDYSIAGVLGTGAEVKVSFMSPGASQISAIFPTGNRQDIINNIPVTLIDCGRTLVIVRAEDLGVTAHETTLELEKNIKLNQELELLRVASAKLMGIQNISKTFPRIAIINHGYNDADISGRYWSNPQDCKPHPAMAMTAAMALSACVCLKGTIFSKANLLLTDKLSEQSVNIEHAQGQVEMLIKGTDAPLNIESCSYKRTARLLAKGKVFF